MFEDAADVLGLIVAFAGVYFGHTYSNPYFDGLASILIGVILTAVSAILAKESRSLLMGETASHQTMSRVIAITETNETAVKVTRHLSMVLAPEEVLVILKIRFQQHASSRHIVTASDAIKKEIQNELPSFRQIFIEPD